MDNALDPQTRENILNAQTVRGIPPTQALVPYANIGALLDERASHQPDRVFLIHYDEQGERRTYTYGEFNRRVNQMANFLREELGLRPGERVATIAHNHPDVLLITFAAWRLGAAVAPQNLAEDDQRIAYILRDSQSRFVFAQAEHLARAERIVAEAPDVREMVPLGGSASGRHIHFGETVARHPPTWRDTAPPERSAECVLVYTSGTTGAPKGVVLTQYNLMVNADAMARWDGIAADDRLMCVLPIHHVNGLVVTHMAPLVAGASVVLNPQFTAHHFWKRLADERVTISSVVPTILQFLVEADEDIRAYDLSRLRFLICGAGTLSVALAQRFEARFGVRIVHGYGLSETTAYACHLSVGLSAEEYRHWMTDFGYPSIGCPFDVNEMAIFDAAGEGRELAEGERGEIAIRGHSVMKHYFQRPDANRETFRYGWFR
ncbi:MAG: acyl--CoA ligase, partial [Chloroflexi bacterium]|nr:acyl--CoA ligase [Chloroflexota bacterium]